ncbi:hypothetical protein [aff. Roholtiella sp. LEGE 12411]|uniref:hypothetical protein n=1 Tax=aff. Roholtiella sp. LEGE 12411 TaxID=1828822 RepID=UPI00188096CC|nr:hypothetical protein [aff. Roholtiella sp. LEGE 12411]MBE9035818.1 hypothetical protein [aff. Roholtiella sp. LEGE 12411]
MESKHLIFAADFPAAQLQKYFSHLVQTPPSQYCEICVIVPVHNEASDVGSNSYGFALPYGRLRQRLRSVQVPFPPFPVSTSQFTNQIGLLYLFVCLGY